MAVLGRPWRHLVTDPQADGEGFGAERFVTLRQCFTPEDFHRTDQGRGTLELLQCQQAQRVTHDDGQTARAVVSAQLALHAPNGHGEGGDAQIGLGLAAPVGNQSKSA